MYGTFEYTNSLTSPSNKYGSINGNHDYNTLIAQKLPPTIPSQNYPVILEQGNKYGYDALTHNSDDNNYYNVKNAYGTNCTPNFFVAKCPQNKFIRPFLPGPKEFISPSACPVENELISEGFTPDLLSKVKALNLVVFYDKSCPHSKNTIQSMINTLGADNVNKFVELRDISKDSNEQELTNLGGYAVPFIFSRTTNNSVTGYFPLEKTLQDLSSSSNNSLSDKIKNLQLKVYIMKGCHFCDRLKELLQNFQSHIEYRNGLDNRWKNELKNVQGFPHIISSKTGKHLTGLPQSLNHLIKHLS